MMMTRMRDGLEIAGMILFVLSPAVLGITFGVLAGMYGPSSEEVAATTITPTTSLYECYDKEN